MYKLLSVRPELSLKLYMEWYYLLNLNTARLQVIFI